ncbi:OLC1v1032190C1 [Oldenlandia corymbosa var. corymbosa]|uniref:OLC1v1032190C1 n=1 Tax=Oldenlandia corymbosa var. corymbosa TaxID=529605 RepID=A0AAV1CLZ4_OLDCO|nr:OLC1v1032190C1 [Oldenlandia corymbosa var. corymbosa]
MAHAALVYLMSLLDTELIQFSFRVLEIEEEKATVFLLRADEVVSKLSEFKNLRDVPDSYMMQLRKGSEPLSLPISEDFINAARSPKVLLDSRPIMKRIPNILDQLYHGYFDASMVMYGLDEEVVSHPAPILIQQQDLLNDLLSANEQFLRIIDFFNRLIQKAEAPYSVASSLLKKLKVTNLHEVNHIKIAAEKAAESIEDMLTVVRNHLFEKEDFTEDSSFHDLVEHIGHTLEGAYDSLKGLNRFMVVGSVQGHLRFLNQIFEPCCAPSEPVRFQDADLLTDLDEDVRHMIQELTKQSHGLTILQVSEMGCIGKPTLAEKVFRHETVVRHFECLARIGSVSTIDQVLSHLLYSIAPTCGGTHHDKNKEDKGKLLCKSLEGKKYLIVLHGLQNLEIWEAIQKYFPDDKVGSRIIVSSVLNPGSSQRSTPVNEDIVVSLDEDTSKIIDQLSRPPSRLSIVTITGMGGIGKSTLAKKVFHHPAIVHHFHSTAWISTVSSIDQVLFHLLQINAPSRRFQALTIEDKGLLLYRSLKGRRYLIVVDGLWNFEVWDAAQRYLPDDNVGSRILITTRVMEFIPSNSIPTNPPHCMEPLDKHQSWELLEKLVFGQESCPEELKAVGKEIAERCGGLPLAIVVIAGILDGIPRSFFSWLSIRIAVTSAVSADAKQCLDILALSYTLLPDYLRACFLYMGVFPANHQIEVEKLLNLWVANGFLNSNSSKLEAEKYLNGLIDRNLVQAGKRSFNGKLKTCFIHDLVRRLCLRQAEKENFMQVVESNAIANDLEKQKHLVFNLEDLDDFQLLPPLPNLHSFIWPNLGSDFTPGMILLQLSAFKRLRVLDMYFVPFDSFPSALLNLVSLRYLALNVTYELDASISQLLKLQTLLVYGPWVSGKGDGTPPTLYLEFWKMPWLRNVYVKVPSYLTYPYPLRPLLDGVQGPSNLQSLSKIAFSSCTKEVFLLMANLKKLGVSETEEDFKNDELTKCFQNLSLLTELETLNCSLYKGNREARILDWNALPISLKKLTLDGSHLSWDEMTSLALLPRLESLKLKNYAFQGSNWVVTEEEVFGSLKHLLIDNTDLANWEVETTDNFPRLQRLVLRSCEFLEMIPCGELSVLEEIELHHCSESAKNSAGEFEEQYGGPKVVTGSYW